MRDDLHLESIDLTVLSVLRSMARCESLGRAAAEHAMSTSKASRLLAQARDLFADPLFIRSSQKMIPTKRMLSLLPKIDALFEIAGSLLDSPDAAGMLARRQHVRIAASDHAFQAAVAPFLRAFALSAPNLDISVAAPSADSLESLRRGDSDILIVQDPRLHLPSECFHSKTLLDSPHGFLLARTNPLVPLLEREAGDREACLAALKGAHCVVNPLPLPSGLARHMSSAWLKSASSVLRLPYFVPSMLLAANSGCLMAVTEAAASTLGPDLPAVFVRMPWMPHWRPKMIWHERTDAAPIQQWLRGKLLLSNRERYADLKPGENEREALHESGAGK